MANLNENPAVFSGGIYQIEMTDPVLGGVPNVDTGAGMSNIPHLQLANRTAFLKKIIDDAGLGAAAVPLVTLDSAQARLTGSYRFASGDANTPATGVAGTVQVIAASASAVNQTAFDSATTRVWTRFWNGTVWSAWSPIARMTGATRSFETSGWQMFPREGAEDPLILQWGSIAVNVTPRDVTLPVSFPNAHLQSFAVESGAGLILFGSVPQTLSTIRIWTSNTSTGVARFFCIGF